MSLTPPPDHPAITIVLPGPSGARQNAICIDTATEMAALALIQDGLIVAEVAWRAGKARTGRLGDRLRTLAAETGYNLAATNIVCVCTGPGSFNGIRTGMATAFGLALGLGAPVYGASALDLLAFPHADRAPAQRALLPAGKGEFYSALFGTRGGRWRRISPYTIGTLETLAAESPAKCLWCGTLEEDEVERLAALLGGARRWVTPAHNVRRAAFLLPLALAEAMAGAPGTPESVQPLYLRRPAITKPRVAVAAAL
ncbi:MAG TPA: tRNA (adenosine(37)-N6)-threonylcarbamoyltransferase complex dimerization subunit type 1 TsaB [Chloroflexota bacterium]|nr:tRNA (adenosine(37)-N6)-threonylcarbamoyltransferase complex dimerization subunit type 1 TsaB [Chloroflexota bacterium]